MPSASGEPYLFSLNPGGERNNVIVWKGDQLLLATMPVEQMQELAKRLAGQEAPERLLGAGARIIPFRTLFKVQINTRSADFTVQTNVTSKDEKLSLALGDQTSAKQFAEAFQRWPGWKSTVEPESRLRVTLTCWTIFGIIAGVTFIFYYGIQTGFIRRGPALLVAILEWFGLTAILVLGGLAMLLAVAYWVVTILNPGNIVTLTPRTGFRE